MKIPEVDYELWKSKTQKMFVLNMIYNSENFCVLHNLFLVFIL